MVRPVATMTPSSITTGSADRRLRDNGEHQRHRKLLTKDAHRIFWTWLGRPRVGGGGGTGGGTTPAAAVICILILAIKIAATSGNAIRNIDHQILINDTAAAAGDKSRNIIGDLSFLRPQNEEPPPHSAPVLPQLVNQDHRLATDANRTTTGFGSASSSSPSSMLGRAATYSYYYIGRKLMYVPLAFLVYWAIYNMSLLGQSIALRGVSLCLIN